MLKHPSRSMSRKLRRSVNPMTRKFVARAQERHDRMRTEKWKRFVRKSQRFVAETQVMMRKWFLVGVGLVACLLLWVVMFSPLFHVREIKVEQPSRRVDIEQVQRKLSPLFRRHMLFVSSYEVESLLGTEFADIASVAVTKSYPSRIIVTLSFHPFIARLKVEEPPSPEVASGAVAVKPPVTFDYLTDNGVFVSLPQAASGSGETLPLLSVVDWAARPVHGSTVLDPEMITQMKLIEDALRAQYNFHVRSRQVYIRAREFHLSNGPLSLWFDLKSTPAESLARLKTFLSAVGFPAVKNYVDLRLKGRVVYR